VCVFLATLLESYCVGHFEREPFTESTKRSIYHLREFEVFKLRLIKQPIDIFMTHDWPRGITEYGDLNELLRRKPFFRNEVINVLFGVAPETSLRITTKLTLLCLDYSE
jgi:lariat debranching enzyme